MNTLGLATEAIRESEGKSKSYMLMLMARGIYPEGHPERLFLEWVHQWEGNIKEGIESLGIEPPPQGPKLLARIKEAVTPVLVNKWRDAPRGDQLCVGGGRAGMKDD